MVAWIVNDLSLAGQFATSKDFLGHFEQLLALGLKPTFKEAGHSVSCAREFQYRTVTADNTIKAVIHAMSAQGQRTIALRWLTKGPFWVAPPEGRGVVYRHIQDVTEQGLGEAARRLWLGEDARTFSFDGLPQFLQSPLDVSCLRDGANEEEFTSVPNDFDVAALEQAVPVARQVIGWKGMLDDACVTFKGLYIAREQILEEMSPYPYSKGARERIFEVLKYLNEYAEARMKHGDGSIQINQWMETYVFSQNAVFSSQNFSDRGIATFLDPNTQKDIFCPWHGKIHNPMQFRVHYEFPIPKGQSLLKVLYIGDHR